jgi:hypothetical protein
MFGSSMQNIGSFSGIAAGSRVSFEMPKRGTYNIIAIRFGVAAGTGLTDANLIAEVGDIELTINGITKVKIFAATMRDIVLNRTGVGFIGWVSIPFYNPRWDNYVDRQDVALGTADVSSLTLSVNLTTVSTLTTMDVYADWDENRIQPLGAHQCYGYQDFNFSGVGAFDNNTINVFGQDVAIEAHHLIFPSTHTTVQPAGTNTGTAFGLWTPDMKGITVEADGITKLNTILAEQLIQSDMMSGYTPVIPLGVPIRYDGPNVNLGVWPMAQVSKLRIRCASLNGGAAYTAAGIAAGNVRIVTEYVSGIGSLRR